jgi:membrane protease YdiL (CAAX protease family)
VGLGLIGNFLCEELYFHGYLMKKIGFLGAWAWVVNSALFALYHVWQAPTTWRAVRPGFLLWFAVLWRKNLYPLIAFRFLVKYRLGRDHRSRTEVNNF